MTLHDEPDGRASAGFTLVELLVVVVILGILAAIVVLAVGGITDRGSTSVAGADTSLLQAAEEAAFGKAAASPVYLGEQALVDSKLLRTLSSRNDICLKADDATTTVNEAATDYKVLAHTQDAAGVTTTGCGLGWTLGSP